METNKSKNFENFLIENRNRQAKKKSLFSFGRVHALFVPLPDQSKMLVIEPELRAKPVRPIPEALDEAKSRFGSLPSGYCTFISVLGPGSWANAIIRHPDYLRPLGWPEDLAHCVPLADNIDGVGNCVLFNPRDQSLNQRIYFGCHDPHGYALLAESFEDWIYAVTPLWMNDPEVGVADLYGKLELTEFA